MSTNCLVTKLKGVVDNSSLLKLNEIRVQFDGTEPLYVRPVEGKSLVISVVGSGMIKTTSKDDSAYRTTIEPGAGQGAEIVSQNNETITISIISKFDLVSIVGSDTVIKCADLKYSTSFTTLRAIIDDDMQSLPKSITSMTLKNTNKIDVQSLSQFVNLHSFEYINSTWKDFSLLAPKSLTHLNTYSSSWSSPTNRPSDAYIFSMYAINVDSPLSLGNGLDNMLTNFANCVMPDKNLTINVYGRETENTVALAAALKAHAGTRLTLKVNGVTY